MKVEIREENRGEKISEKLEKPAHKPAYTKALEKLAYMENARRNPRRTGLAYIICDLVFPTFVVRGGRDDFSLKKR